MPSCKECGDPDDHHGLPHSSHGPARSRGQLRRGLRGPRPRDPRPCAFVGLQANHPPHEWAMQVEVEGLDRYQVQVECPGLAVFESLTDVEEFLNDRSEQ